MCQLQFFGRRQKGLQEEYMELSQQVCSLEQAKRLKELGVKQESLFYWAGGELYVKTGICVINMNDCGIGTFGYIQEGFNDFCSAFTVAELGEMLPKYIRKEDGKWWNIYDFMMFMPTNSGSDSYLIKYVEGDWDHGFNDDSRCLWAEEDDNLANCMAKMLAYLLENKLNLTE